MRTSKAFILIFLSGAIFLASCSSSNKKVEDQKSEQVQATGASEAATFMDFDDAIVKAKAEKKLVLLDFYTDWCGWCKKMDKDVYPDKAVRETLSRYFTVSKVNAESSKLHLYDGGQHSEQQIAQHLGVDSYPTIIIMSPDGQVVQKIPGYMPAEKFALAMRYFGSGAYQSQDFESWQKGQS